MIQGWVRQDRGAASDQRWRFQLRQRRATCAQDLQSHIQKFAATVKERLPWPCTVRAPPRASTRYLRISILPSISLVSHKTGFESSPWQSSVTLSLSTSDQAQTCTRAAGVCSKTTRITCSKIW